MRIHSAASGIYSICLLLVSFGCKTNDLPWKSDQTRAKIHYTSTIPLTITERGEVQWELLLRRSVFIFESEFSDVDSVNYELQVTKRPPGVEDGRLEILHFNSSEKQNLGTKILPDLSIPINSLKEIGEFLLVSSGLEQGKYQSTLEDNFWQSFYVADEDSESGARSGIWQFRIKLDTVAYASGPLRGFINQSGEYQLFAVSRAPFNQLNGDNTSGSLQLTEMLDSAKEGRTFHFQDIIVPELGPSFQHLLYNNESDSVWLSISLQ